MHITEALLIRKHACSEQVAKFAKLFPDGVTITVALCMEHAAVFDWGWAASNLLAPAQRAAYDKAMDEAWAAYAKARDEAGAEAWEAYAKARDEAGAAYDKARDEAWAVYAKTTDEAWAAYDKARDEAGAEAFANAALAEQEARGRALSGYQGISG